MLPTQAWAVSYRDATDSRCTHSRTCQSQDSIKFRRHGREPKQRGTASHAAKQTAAVPLAPGGPVSELHIPKVPFRHEIIRHVIRNRI